MSYGVAVKFTGSFALFTRPEMKVERVSYDVPTPSAAKGMMEAIYYKPEIKWIIDRIHVLNPIKYMSFRRNEVNDILKIKTVTSAMNGGEWPSLCVSDHNVRTQRAALILTDVSYIIEAHFEIVNGENNPGKHYNIFTRRAKKGQCYKQPYLGCREFGAFFELIEKDELPTTTLSLDEQNKYLGYMFLGIDYEHDMRSYFFQAWLRNGIIDIPSMPF